MNIVPDSVVIASECIFSFEVTPEDRDAVLALTTVPPELAKLEPELAGLAIRSPRITATHKNGKLRIMFEHEINPKSRVHLAQPRGPGRHTPKRGPSPPEMKQRLLEQERELAKLKAEQDKLKPPEVAK